MVQLWHQRKVRSARPSSQAWVALSDPLFVALVPDLSLVPDFFCADVAILFYVQP
jgi:hypothetical protein